MSERIARIATVAAVALAIAAIATLYVGRHVLSGTLFICTAFAIYLRETNA